MSFLQETRIPVLISKLLLHPLRTHVDLVLRQYSHRVTEKASRKVMS